jgi:hypothetical protein
MKKIINAVNLIGFLLHETSHALMAVLLYPFGSSVSGVKIISGASDNGGYVFEGWVATNSKFKVCETLIAVAPLITWVSVWVWFLLTGKLILLAVWGFFLHSMWPSKDDWSNALLRPNRVMKSDELNVILNAALDRSLRRITND